MKIRYYTDKELESLTNNMFVNKIRYKRTIEYDVVFKLWCIMMRLKYPELTGKQIFEKGGFDTDILHTNLPYRRIGEWLNNYKKFGLDYFLPELAPYHSLDIKKSEKKTDPVKLRLLQASLEFLREYDRKK